MTPISPEESARELTVLAWRRTMLRWVVIAVVGTRLFTEEFGAPVVAVALVAIVGAALINLAVSRQYSRVSTGSGLPSFGVPYALRRAEVRLALVAVATVALGIAALAWALFL